MAINFVYDLLMSFIKAIEEGPFYIFQLLMDPIMDAIDALVRPVLEPPLNYILGKVVEIAEIINDFLVFLTDTVYFIGEMAEMVANDIVHFIQFGVDLIVEMLNDQVNLVLLLWDAIIALKDAAISAANKG